MSEIYKTLKVKELQEMLQKNGLPHTGKKEELLERLVKFDERKAMESLEKEFELEDDFDDSKLSLEDAIYTSIILDKPTFYEKESVLSDDEEVFAPAVVEKKADTSSPAAENIITALVTELTSPAAETISETPATTTEAAPASSFKFTPITFESKTPVKAAAPAKVVTKKFPASKVPAAKSLLAKAAASNTKLATKASGSKVVTPKASASKFTASVKPTPIASKSVRPTRSTKTPLPRAVKPSSPSSTTASLAIRNKKVQPTAEQIDKARLEAERKLERSKRFGIKMNEKDMKEIRAARFGITPTEEKKKGVEQDKPVTAKKKDTAQDILKKRAERFGIPEKKIVPVKKAPVKVEVTKKTNNIVTKNQVKQGRVQKMSPKTVLTNKKTVIKTVTKTNVLNKKQDNVTSRLSGSTITQNKRTIVNSRKVNITKNSKPQGRVITIAPIRPAPERKMKTSPRDIIINANNNIRRPAMNKRPVANDIGNGRIVTVGPTTNASNKRRRGRGTEPPHQPKDKKRRN